MFCYINLSSNYSLSWIYLTLSLLVWMVPDVQAQYSGCFKEKFKKGIEEASKKKYNEAINLFYAAITTCKGEPNEREIKDAVDQIKKAQMAIEQDLTKSRDMAITAQQIAEEALKIAEKAKEKETTQKG